MLPAHTSYPVWLCCRVKSTRAQGLTTPRQMVRCPSQRCHNRAYKKSSLDQSHSQLRHPSFPLVVRRVCCLSPTATVKRSSCMVRLEPLYAATYPGCTTIYHFMTTNDNLEALQEPALSASRRCPFSALFIVSRVAEDAQVQVKCSVLLSQVSIIVLFMWCTGYNTSSSKNCAAALFYIPRHWAALCRVEFA